MTNNSNNNNNHRLPYYLRVADEAEKIWNDGIDKNYFGKMGLTVNFRDYCRFINNTGGMFEFIDFIKQNHYGRDNIMFYIHEAILKAWDKVKPLD